MKLKNVWFLFLLGLFLISFFLSFLFLESDIDKKRNNEYERKINQYKQNLIIAQDKITQQEQEIKIRSEEKCLTGNALLEGEYFIFDVGGVQFCGNNLHFSNIYGPSLVEFINAKEEENAELYNQTVRLQEQIDQLKADIERSNKKK